MPHLLFFLGKNDSQIRTLLAATNQQLTEWTKLIQKLNFKTSRQKKQCQNPVLQHLQLKTRTTHGEIGFVRAIGTFA